MVSQYPHKIRVTVSEDSTVDGSGDFVEGSTSTQETPCRAEPANGNGLIKAADGKQVNYDWTVYMSLPASTIAVGSLVEIYNGEELLARDRVKRFSCGQLNARLWL